MTAAGWKWDNLRVILRGGAMTMVVVIMIGKDNDGNDEGKGIGSNGK